MRFPFPEIFESETERERYLEITQNLIQYYGCNINYAMLRNISAIATPPDDRKLQAKLNSHGRQHLLVDVLVTLCEQGLTLRSLIHACEAASTNPSAAMLTLAFVNSVPGLKNLPTEHADPTFFIKAAKYYFSHPTIMMESLVHRVTSNRDGEFELYLNHHPVDMLEAPFPIGEFGKSRARFPDRYAYCVENLLNNLFPVTGIKKGREFIKELLLKWRDYYEEKRDKRIPKFIDRIVWQLDNVHVFQFGMVTFEEEGPGKEFGMIAFGGEPEWVDYDGIFDKPPFFRK